MQNANKFQTIKEEYEKVSQTLEEKIEEKAILMREEIELDKGIQILE